VVGHLRRRSLKHALGPEALFDADLSVGRDLLAMLAFVVLALSPACRRFSQAPGFESVARAFTAQKRHLHDLKFVNKRIPARWRILRRRLRRVAHNLRAALDPVARCKVYKANGNLYLSSSQESISFYSH
jgi:hypothetical protein